MRHVLLVVLIATAALFGVYAGRASLPDAPQPTAKPTVRVNTGGAGTKPTVTKPACNCTPGDPLCSCL